MSEFLLLHDNDHDGKPAVRSFQDVKPIRTFIKNEK